MLGIEVGYLVEFSLGKHYCTRDCWIEESYIMKHLGWNLGTLNCRGEVGM